MENIRSIISIELEIYRAFCITTRSISWNLSCILQTNWPHRQELCQVANWAVVKNLIQLYWVLHIFFPPWIMIIPNIHQYTSIVSIPYLLGIYGLYAAKNCCPIPGSDSTSVCRKSCSSETRRAHTSLCYKFLMGISLVTGLKMIQLWLIMLLVVNNGD